MRIIKIRRSSRLREDSPFRLRRLCRGVFTGPGSSPSCIVRSSRRDDGVSSSSSILSTCAQRFSGTCDFIPPFNRNTSFSLRFHFIISTPTGLFKKSANQHRLKGMVVHLYPIARSRSTVLSASWSSDMLSSGCSNSLPISTQFT